MTIEKDKIIPYSATTISMVARFIFMYLLYTKKSTNHLSLLFCILNLISSSLWIQYCIEIEDTALVLRSSADLVVFSFASSYIVYNRNKQQSVVENIEKVNQGEEYELC